MSILDTWFTGVQTAATSVATALAGAGAAWLALRKKVGVDSSELGLMRSLTTERDEYKTLWKESMNRIQTLTEELGREKGLREDAQDRATELLRQELYHQQKIGACDEKVRELSQRVQVMGFENSELFAEVARLDPAAAKRLTQHRWKPANATGPEQVP